MKKYKIFIIYILLLVFILAAIVIVKKETIFRNMGEFLYVEAEPEKADIIVVLRKDTNYSRVLEGSNLFMEGYAEYIFISTALTDSHCYRLKSFGVVLPIRQERLRSVLMQLGIPEERIILDHRPPGGGTEGELKRVKNMMEQNNYKKALIITNWYHTRRSNAICRKIFDESNLEYLVIAARDDISSPVDWWKYRYEAISVLEEFPKLIVFHINSVFRVSFADDPASN